LLFLIPLRSPPWDHLAVRGRCRRQLAQHRLGRTYRIVQPREGLSRGCGTPV